MGKVVGKTTGAQTCRDVHTLLKSRRGSRVHLRCTVCYGEDLVLSANNLVCTTTSMQIYFSCDLSSLVHQPSWACTGVATLVDRVPGRRHRSLRNPMPSLHHETTVCSQADACSSSAYQAHVPDIRAALQHFDIHTPGHVRSFLDCLR